MMTTEKKLELILIEEGASHTLLSTVETHRLDRLARRIRAELGLGAANRPQINLRRAAQLVAVAKATDAAKAAREAAQWTAKMEGLKAHFAR